MSMTWKWLIAITDEWWTDDDMAVMTDEFYEYVQIYQYFIFFWIVFSHEH